MLARSTAQILIAKCLGRRICTHCGKNYNVADIYIPEGPGQPQVHGAQCCCPPGGNVSTMLHWDAPHVLSDLGCVSTITISACQMLSLPSLLSSDIDSIDVHTALYCQLSAS